MRRKPETNLYRSAYEAKSIESFSTASMQSSACENVSLGVGCSARSRLYELDSAGIGRYQREYAPLAYLLEESGFPVDRVSSTNGSDQEKAIKTSAQKRLMADAVSNRSSAEKKIDCD